MHRISKRCSSYISQIWIMAHFQFFLHFKKYGDFSIKLHLTIVTIAYKKIFNQTTFCSRLCKKQYLDYNNSSVICINSKMDLLRVNTQQGFGQ